MRSKTNFFLKKTKSALKQLGAVAIIISLSVMFSSLCIMSLISLSDALSESMTGNPRGQLGGDVKVYVSSEYSEQINGKLKQLKSSNVVTDFSSLDTVSQQYVLYRADTFGLEYISVVGYNNASYPLSNVMTLVSGKKNMEELLHNDNGIVISEIVAKKSNIKIGDTITLVSNDLFKQEKFNVVDLISSDYAGSVYSVYISENRLKTFENISNVVYYIDGDQEQIKAALSEIQDPGITISTLDEYSKHQKESDRTYLLFIRGISVLGLFIGSFGIASAIKVIVDKRKRELGILKAIGFVEKDIIKMLLAEVAVISVIGSILGVGLGYAFFYYLVNILLSGDNVNIVINSGFNLIAAGLAFGVSIVSSLLFAYLTIKDMSGIKPVYALKEIDYVKTKREKRITVLRFLLIAVIFCGISILLAQSVIYGLGAVALVTIVIFLFSLLFRLLFFLILKIPIRTHNEFELAWINLRLNYRKIVVSMVAIFIGMGAVNLIDTLVYSTKQVYQSKYTEVESNINVVTDQANPTDNSILSILEDSNAVTDYVVLYKAKVDTSSDYFTNELIGTDISKIGYFYKIIEGSQSSEGIIISKDEKDIFGYQVGDKITITFMGNIFELPITGIYQIDYSSNVSTLVYPTNARFITMDGFRKYFGQNYIEETWVSTKKEDEEVLLDKISNIPNVIITSSKQIENMINSAINILINFSTSVASLALLAGIILIITVTVLDVVSRRRDFAIFKVIGFKQSEVSLMVLLEYGIMTLITSSFATLVVYLFTLFMNAYGQQLFQINEKMIFDLKGSLIWNVGLIVLVLVLVFGVSRKTLKVKPSEVLRYE